MSISFWKKIKENAMASQRPIVLLAPMADVTDVSFRAMFAKYGKPDVFWTEFVSADGLFHTAHKAGIESFEDALGARDALKEKTQRQVEAKRGGSDVDEFSAFDNFLKDLEFGESERPIVAQLFGSNPETMEWASELCRHLGFDGIDINMGCPDRSVEKQKAGAAMIKYPDLAREIIQAAKRGAGDLPVSVKTRLGYNTDQLAEWLPVLLSENLAAVTLHARTRKEMSKVPARWERVAHAVEMRDDLEVDTLIFGNGDIADLDDGLKKWTETGCDGVMLGRSIFGNPWCFNFEKNRDRDISISERLKVMVEHTFLFEKLLPNKNFALMKKHFKAYVDGFDGAKELRARLMEAENGEEIEGIVDKFLSENK